MEKGAGTLLYDRASGVATLTLNRPEARNALSPQLVEALIEALARAKADPEVRVVVLTGAGERAFCAGGDLGGGGLLSEGVLAAHRARARFADLLREMARLGKPIVARVSGDALGGGFGLALACDLVIAAEDARMGTPEIDLGLFPHVILAVLARNVPRKVLQRMVLTGERFPAARGVEWGFVTEAVPRASLDEAVGRWTARLLEKSPAILRLGRDSLYAMQDMTFEQGLDFLSAQLTLNTLAEDAMEGVAAFLQKRPPEWKGR